MEQSYTVQFAPPPNCGKSGDITVQPCPTGESVTVRIWGSESYVSWSLSQFEQFEHDLGEALVVLGGLSTQKIITGVYRAQVGQWLEIVCHSDGWYCNVGAVAQLHQESEVRAIIRSLPSVRQVVDEALATFRRLRK